MYATKEKYKAYQRKWYRDNKAHVKQRARNWRLKNEYGITPAKFNEMMEAQEGRCAICRQTSDRHLDVDHNHTTGKVRGLLCNKCNQAIGLLNEDPLRLESALRYLQ